MASIRVILRKRANSDDTHSLIIRIVKDRKASIIALGHSIPAKDWDSKTQQVKKSFPNASRLNNLISKKLSEANAKLIELETNNTDTSSRVILKAVKATKQGTFFKQAALYLLQLENAVSSTACLLMNHE